jgi:hypothetical protein
MYSCALVQRSRTDSGMGFGLCQMMSWRRYQPSSWRAKATRQGMPIRSFSFSPSWSLFGLFSRLPFSSEPEPTTLRRLHTQALA